MAGKRHYRSVYSLPVSAPGSVWVELASWSPIAHSCRRKFALRSVPSVQDFRLTIAYERTDG